MRYRVRHVTRYVYDHEISLSHHVARATPRTLPRQQPLSSSLEVHPDPATRSSHTDAFGNEVTFLIVEGPHRELHVTARCEVEVQPASHPAPGTSPAWETLREQFAEGHGDVRDYGPFLFASPHVPCLPALAEFARPAFAPQTPWLSALDLLNALIHREFTFDPAATHVSTPVETVLRRRRGVCQDFAHLMLGCLRSLGLPARYVSGYLETIPPAGRSRLAGADASHAWVSAYCPGWGWVDFDPTNDLRASDRHLTVAWGRDYSDVSPLRGVLVGAGNHELHVAVDVEPVIPA